MEFRERGVLGKPHWDSDRPGLMAIPVDFGGSVQHFISPWLPPKSEHRSSFINELCAAFGVKDLEALEGQGAFALRSFDFWNEPIEGLESEKTGRRLTVLGWARRHGVGHGEDRLTDRNDSIEKEIRFLERRVAEEVERRRTLEQHYKDWEAES